METCDCLCFLRVNVENRVQLGDLQKVANLFVEVQKLYFSTLAFDQTIAADQFSESGAVDIIDSRTMTPPTSRLVALKLISNLS